MNPGKAVHLTWDNLGYYRFWDEVVGYSWITSYFEISDFGPNYALGIL